MSDSTKILSQRHVTETGQDTFTHAFFTSRLIVLFLLPFFFVHCSGSDDQQEFERQAFQSPSGITETDGSGELIGDRDPDDWRIAPFFQGVVEIDPAFPNPAQTTDEININILVTGLESVMGIRAAVLFDNEPFRILDFNDTAPLPPGLMILRFQARDLFRFENETGLRRVIIFDGSENIISYGDILVE